MLLQCVDYQRIAQVLCALGLKVGKSDNFHPCSRAYGLFRTRSKSITDSTDATDFIFSRISFSLGFITDFIAPDGAGLPSVEQITMEFHVARHMELCEFILIF